jgi:hypothetical protein
MECSLLNELSRFCRLPVLIAEQMQQRDPSPSAMQRCSLHDTVLVRKHGKSLSQPINPPHSLPLIRYALNGAKPSLENSFKLAQNMSGGIASNVQCK